VEVRRSVLLVDETPLYHLGVSSLLQSTSDLELVGAENEARAALPLIDRLRPNVALVSVGLRGMDGLAACREIRRRAANVAVLMLSPGPRARDVLEAFRAGAVGAVARQAPPTLLVEAIRTAAKRQRVSPPDGALDPEVLDRGDLLATLSVREREVFALITQGLDNQRIARELCVSAKTVESHRATIYRKLRCHSAVDLVLFAVRNGLTTLGAL
jgi:two-component system nitrate/nitrite response regulator NarL